MRSKSIRFSIFTYSVLQICILVPYFASWHRVGVNARQTNPKMTGYSRLLALTGFPGAPSEGVNTDRREAFQGSSIWALNVNYDDEMCPESMHGVHPSHFTIIVVRARIDPDCPVTYRASYWPGSLGALMDAGLPIAVGI